MVQSNFGFLNLINSADSQSHGRMKEWRAPVALNTNGVWGSKVSKWLCVCCAPLSYWIRFYFLSCLCQLNKSIIQTSALEVENKPSAPVILSTQAGQTKSDLRIPLSILHRIKRLIALRSGRKSAFSSRPSFALLQFQQKSKQRAASNSSEQKPALSFFLSFSPSLCSGLFSHPSFPPSSIPPGRYIGETWLFRRLRYISLIPQIYSCAPHHLARCLLQCP